MIISRDIWVLESAGGYEAVVLTDSLREYVRGGGCSEGYVNLFYRHTTGAIIITEYEIGILADLEALLSGMAPANHPYKHHLRGVDRNGHSHLWSILLSPSAGVTIPFSGGELLLGEFQEVVMIDLQTGSGPREIVVQLVGVEPHD